MKKECKNCGKRFDNRIVVDGKTHIVANRKHCLDCVPFKSGLKLRHKSLKIEPVDLICNRCGKEYTYVRSGGTKKYCPACYQKIRMIRRKEKAVKYKGGKCCLCGYNKTNVALDFHHVDAKEKDYVISLMYNLSWDRMRDELDKCVMVCSNCHREIHDGLIDQGVIEQRWKEVVSLLSPDDEKYDIGPPKTISCLECKKEFVPDCKKMKYCSPECSQKNRRIFDPTKEELAALIIQYSMEKIGRMNGVSGKTVKKAAARLGLR